MNEIGFCSECGCREVCEFYGDIVEGSLMCKEIRRDNGEDILMGMDMSDRKRLFIDYGDRKYERWWE